jgi:hypothetical protein
MDDVPGGLDALDLGEAELDPGVQLGVARPDDLVRIGQPEGHEQQPRLVDMAVVAVDDHDLRGMAVQALQAVGGQRPAGSGAQNDDAMAHVHTSTLCGTGACRDR